MINCNIVITKLIFLSFKSAVRAVKLFIVKNIYILFEKGMIKKQTLIYICLGSLAVKISKQPL